ncbi:hypothetical protein [Burkholderia phage BCSR5]|nr:hypothetical protein [Burkholderia phage BCSR5]
MEYLNRVFEIETVDALGGSHLHELVACSKDEVREACKDLEIVAIRDITNTLN